MKSLVLNVDDIVYDKLVNFLKIFPSNKIKIIEEIPCSKPLEKELIKRKKEIISGETISHNDFWKDAGL